MGRNNKERVTWRAVENEHPFALWKDIEGVGASVDFGAALVSSREA